MKLCHESVYPNEQQLFSGPPFTFTAEFFSSHFDLFFHISVRGFSHLAEFSYVAYFGVIHVLPPI